ncbi:hypothetical protein JOM56_012695 [Amanita muscaria]
MPHHSGDRSVGWYGGNVLLVNILVELFLSQRDSYLPCTLLKQLKQFKKTTSIPGAEGFALASLLPVIRTTPMVLSLVGKQNQPFTEDELDIIRQSRLAAEESLQHVHAEIKDKEEHLSRQVEMLESELSVLASQACDLIDKIERYSTALSPHNKLPPEILRHIFKCCIQEKQVEEIPVTYKGGAYTISHVCAAWRRIALDTLELWTGISLQLTKVNEKRIQVARQWLSRARTLPKSISIKQDSLECDGWGNSIILNLVAHYHLQSLELTLPHKQLKQLKGLLDRSVSTLEVLRLKCSPPWRGTGTCKSSLQSAPGPGSFTSKSNQRFLPHNASSFFNDALKLKSAPFPDIVLPQIYRLWIYTGGVTTKMLVDAVTAPKLKSLSFRQIRPQASSDVDTAAFCQMIERCQGMKHLTSFRVGPTSEPLSPLTLLEKLPHLEMMQISNGILNEGAINRILLGKVGSKLKKMIFCSRHDANEILRMVEVRRQNANLNNYGPLARVSPFTEITFNCVSVYSSLKEELISRKNALENSQGKISINLTFD